MNFLCRFFFIAALLLVCQPASAEKRVALVLGNSNYKNAAVLPNPVNDAAAVAATLKARVSISLTQGSIFQPQTCGERCEISLIKLATPTWL